MRFNFYFKRKKYSVNIIKTGFFRKGLGLMFRTKNTSNLLFEFNRSVTWQGNLTSWFVFFPFLTLWLNEKSQVIDLEVIYPFKFSINQKKRFHKIIEIPFNEANKKLIMDLIGKNNALFRRKFA